MAFTLSEDQFKKERLSEREWVQTPMLTSTPSVPVDRK